MAQNSADDGLSFRGYVREVRIDWEKVKQKKRYPFSLPAVRALDRLVLHPKVTFFVGENGSGKSTLIEAIAVAWGFNAEGGSKKFQFDTRASHSDLAEYLTLAKGFDRPANGFFLRAETEHYAVTREFLNNPERMLSILLE